MGEEYSSTKTFTIRNDVIRRFATLHQLPSNFPIIQSERRHADFAVLQWSSILDGCLLTTLCIIQSFLRVLPRFSRPKRACSTRLSSDANAGSNEVASILPSSPCRFLEILLSHKTHGE